MSKIPSDLKYSEDHEWVRVEADGTATVGITDHAQKTLGDIVFIELPEIGRKLSAHDSVGVVESVKAASDIFTPVSGEIVAANQELGDAPEMANEEPYGDGWIFKIKLSDKSDLDKLLSPDAYAKLIAE